MSMIRSLWAAVSVAALSLASSVVAVSAALLLAVVVGTPAHAAEVAVTTGLGQGVIPLEGGKVYLRLSLKAAPVAKREGRTPVNVALVLDRSGSMQGDRIIAAKEAAEMALSRLGADDVVSLVAYNHDVDVMVPAGRLGTAHDKFQAAIAKLTAEGQTALYAGVVEGGREVKRNVSERKINRVILMSDGMANVGPSTPNELGALGQKLGGDGISVTTIGLGLGYNEDLMSRLASASDGNHAFAAKPEDLVRIFNAEFGDALSVAAQDIEIIIECREGFKPKRVLGREAEIEGSRIKVKLSQLNGGAERYLVVELDAASAGAATTREVADVAVRYLDLDAGARRDAVATAEVRYSADTKEQEASVEPETMSKVAVQVATETTEEAVRLRDAGDIAGAKKLLESNDVYIDGVTKQFGPAAPAAAVGALRDLKSSNQAATGSIDSDQQWGAARKGLRYEQHKAKRQQSY